MKLYLASGNAHKVAEFQALAAASRFALKIVSAREVGGMPPVEEDTGTFIGNARKKAHALKTKIPPNTWVLADDSGLCVDALGGAPGVESAYYAGPAGDGAANLAKLVATMRNVEKADRAARFVCVLLLHAPDGAEYVYQGRCEGRLAEVPSGGGGFGYDPLFIPEGHSCTFSDLPEGTKNTLSHRGRAWNKLAEAQSIWLRVS